MFTILHTNDFHNRIIPALVAQLKRLRQDLGSNGLLLDAGDAVGSRKYVTFRPGGEPILDAMTAIGYDALTVGNREFHFSRFGFQTKLSRARFPVLCANVRFTGEFAGAGRLPVCSYISSDLAGWFRIVVFGLTVPMITARMASRHVSAYVFDDPIKVGTELAARLRSELRPNLAGALTQSVSAKIATWLLRPPELT